MNMFINALILALLVPAAAPQKVQDGPACRAELQGMNLMTTLEFPSGRQVDGPWQVIVAEQTEDGSEHMMLATLDRIIETDALTGERNVVPFPEPVSLAFQAATQRDLLHRAAQVWCVTVMRAQENPALRHMAPRAEAANVRVAALPRADSDIAS
jgi:hypothetical protein